MNEGCCDQDSGAEVSREEEEVVGDWQLRESADLLDMSVETPTCYRRGDDTIRGKEQAKVLNARIRKRAKTCRLVL